MSPDPVEKQTFHFAESERRLTQSRQGAKSFGSKVDLNSWRPGSGHQEDKSVQRVESLWL